MPKYTSPAVTPLEALKWLPTALQAPLSVHMVCTPYGDGKHVYAGVEIHYKHRDGCQGLVKREGERVSAERVDHITGAWLRAACRLAQRLDGVSNDELVRLYLWEADKLS